MSDHKLPTLSGEIKAGDGTAERKYTILVDLPDRLMRSFDPVEFRPASAGEWYYSIDNGTILQATINYRFPALIFRPKSPPAPHPWLIELAKRTMLEDGDENAVRLPPMMKKLRWDKKKGGWTCGLHTTKNRFWWVWDYVSNGPLPPRDADTPNEVTVEEIRAAREWVKQQQSQEPQP